MERRAAVDGVDRRVRERQRGDVRPDEFRERRRFFFEKEAALRFPEHGLGVVRGDEPEVLVVQGLEDSPREEARPAAEIEDDAFFFASRSLIVVVVVVVEEGLQGEGAELGEFLVRPGEAVPCEGVAPAPFVEEGGDRRPERLDLDDVRRPRGILQEVVAEPLQGRRRPRRDEVEVGVVPGVGRPRRGIRIGRGEPRHEARRCHKSLLRLRIDEHRVDRPPEEVTQLLLRRQSQRRQRHRRRR
mmetsp:Transcript_13213/g.43073  ORF Transcript_13213/g.43073 Transcript_13213/m.43073 type:complete len:243 (+) Transcript_13213:571-1299(+)